MNDVPPIVQLEKETIENEYFRHVLHTTDSLQLVLMYLRPHVVLGPEVHRGVVQFVRVEQGSGVVTIDGKDMVLLSGDSVIVTGGKEHTITASSEGMKLYTIYSKPMHKHGLIERY